MTSTQCTLFFLFARNCTIIGIEKKNVIMKKFEQFKIFYFFI